MAKGHNSQLSPTSSLFSTTQADLLKFGIDIHKRDYVVVAQ